MSFLVAGLGIVLLFSALWDAFETIVLPRRVRRRFRLTRFFFVVTWSPWILLSRLLRNRDRRESFMSFYGPISLLVLLAVWAVTLVIGFALLQWSLGSALTSPETIPDFSTDLYMSGETFFTLGFGDIVPRPGLARFVAVVEAGMGFAFLGLVIGYLPTIYQAFSRRETTISLLDARAGSPPSAVELLRRFANDEMPQSLNGFLHDWELWASEVLESHLSYPVLGYFRSQHENQSWVAAITVILDVCALIIVGIDGIPSRTAHLTFAMARHAAVDLSQVYNTQPYEQPYDRLPETDLPRLRQALLDAGMPLRSGPDADRKLAEFRGKYEPYVASLVNYLRLALPPWIPPEGAKDNWQTSAWDTIDGSANI